MLALKTDQIIVQDQSVASLMPFLNKLRFLASDCRASSRLDLFEACKVISLNEQTASDSFARILVRVIGQALDKPMVFLAPGTETRSFDEDWLLRVLECRARSDDDSYLFLLMRRVPVAKRESLSRLLTNIAKELKK